MRREPVATQQAPTEEFHEIPQKGATIEYAVTFSMLEFINTYAQLLNVSLLCVIFALLVRLVREFRAVQKDRFELVRDRLDALKEQYENRIAALEEARLAFERLAVKPGVEQQVKAKFERILEQLTLVSGDLMTTAEFPRQAEFERAPTVRQLQRAPQEVVVEPDDAGDESEGMEDDDTSRT
jgi:hypothetical protein